MTALEEFGLHIYLADPVPPDFNGHPGFAQALGDPLRPAVWNGESDETSGASDCHIQDPECFRHVRVRAGLPSDPRLYGSVGLA